MADKTKKEELKKHYLSGKEAREIAKKNKEFVKQLEKRKKRKNADASEYTTEMKDPRNIVEFDNLHTYFFTDAGVSKAVNGVSFSIPENSVVGIVGESGCGKSVTSLSLMQLIQGPTGQIVKGEIRFKASEFKKDENGKPIPVYKKKLDENGNVVKDENGNDVIETAPVLDKHGKPVVDKEGNVKYAPVQARDEAGVLKYETEEKVYDIARMPLKDMSKIRGRQIAMIFQEPMTSLNPVFTIGNQLDEVTLLHIRDADKAEAKRRSLEMLELVGIAMPERVYKSYPHELSGGMRQRVSFARTLVQLWHGRELMLLDEPFSALDSLTRISMQDWLIGQVKGLDATVMMVTHDVEEAMLVGNKIFLLSGRPVKQIKVIDVSHITCREDLYTQSSVELKNELVRAFLTEKAERGDNI